MPPIVSRTARLGLVVVALVAAAGACSSTDETADTDGTASSTPGSVAGSSSTVADQPAGTTTSQLTTDESIVEAFENPPNDPDLPDARVDGAACVVQTDTGINVLRITGTIEGDVPDGVLVVRLDNGVDLAEIAGDLVGGTFDLGGDAAPGRWGVVEAILQTPSGELVDLSVAFAEVYGMTVVIPDTPGEVAGTETCPA